MTPQKRRLLKLKNSKQFLFHGSGEKLDILRPHQAYNHLKKGKKKSDGKPAVFASENPDVAVFMAIFSDNNFLHLQTWFGEDENGNPLFKATKETLDVLSKDMTGYVYVLEKKLFKKRNNGAQWTSNVAVVPIEIIKVTSNDLPEIKAEEF